MENVISNAERRGLANGEQAVVPRVSDIYAALPSITGKLELEYEGEQRGAAAIARELIKKAVGKTFEAYFEHIDCGDVVAWFNDGGTLRVSDVDGDDLCMKNFRQVSGLLGVVKKSGLADQSPAVTVAVCELVLEGLHAQKKISRSDERGYGAAKQESRGYGYENFSRSRRIN
jgi:magnesium chelatase subunit I